MDNLLLAFSDLQIRPKVGFAPAAVIRKSDVMEEIGQWPSSSHRRTQGYQIPGGHRGDSPANLQA
jgi:hypothetical protein